MHPPQLLVPIGGVDVPFPVEEIPTFSLRTKEIFESLGHTVPESLPSLQGRAQEWKAACLELEGVEANPWRHRVLAFLKTALLISILTLGIFGSIFSIASGVGAMAAPPIILGTILLYLFACYKLAPNTCKQVLQGASSTGAILLLFLGAFAPIYEAYRKVPNLQTSTQAREDELRRSVEEAVQFYQNGRATLNEQFAHPNHIALHTGSAEDLRDIETARNELRLAVEYYIRANRNLYLNLPPQTPA